MLNFDVDERISAMEILDSNIFQLIDIDSQISHLSMNDMKGSRKMSGATVSILHIHNHRLSDIINQSGSHFRTDLNMKALSIDQKNQNNGTFKREMFGNSIYREHNVLADNNESGSPGVINDSRKSKLFRLSIIEELNI